MAHTRSQIEQVIADHLAPERALADALADAVEADMSCYTGEATAFAVQHYRAGRGK